MTADETAGDEPELLAWWVVADVDDDSGGLRHFAPGETLWVHPPQWGDGERNVSVVGRHRGAETQDYVRAVVPRRHLTGFRVRGVYSPAVLSRLTEPVTLGWPSRLWLGRDEAERAAARWNAEPPSS